MLAWLKSFFVSISRHHEEKVPDTVRACDWDTFIRGMRIIDPALVAALEGFIARLQLSVDAFKVPVYARLLLRASSFRFEERSLKIAVFPLRRDMDYQLLERIAQHASAGELVLGPFDDYDIGPYSACDQNVAGTHRCLKVMIPASDWSDCSLPTRVRNEENPNEPEYEAKPFRYAYVAIRPAETAAG